MKLIEQKTKHKGRELWRLSWKVPCIGMIFKKKLFNTLLEKEYELSEDDYFFVLCKFMTKNSTTYYFITKAGHPKSVDKVHKEWNIPKKIQPHNSDTVTEKRIDTRSH